MPLAHWHVCNKLACESEAELHGEEGSQKPQQTLQKKGQLAGERLVMQWLTALYAPCPHAVISCCDFMLLPIWTAVMSFPVHYETL